MTKARSEEMQPSPRKRGGNAASQLVDNRSEIAAQRKLQGMANSSRQVNRLQAFQEIADNGPQARTMAQFQTTGDFSQAAIQRKQSLDEPLQGKFIGELAKPLMGLNLTPLGLEDSLFAQFRAALESHKDNITVVDGPNRYDAATKAIYLNKTMFSDLEKFKNQRLSDEEGPVTAETAVSHVAAITHELSHARDNVIVGKDVSSGVKNVIESELRAWTFEAIGALQAGKSLKGMDEEKGKLIEGWVSIKTSMLGDLEGNLENAVINRLDRYLKRELGSENKLVVQGWVNVNEEWITEQIVKFSTYAKKNLTE